MRTLTILACFLGLLSCDDRPPTTPETRPVAFPNAGNTAIYDVDPDDPYEIGDGEFLTLRPGQPLTEYGPELIERRPSNENSYWIFGRRNDTLGYVVADGARIVSIHVTAPTVVTQNGLRVGMQSSEVRQRQHTVDEVTFEYATAERGDKIVKEIILR